MSKTIAYVLVSFINQLLQWTGVDVAPEGVDVFINVGLGILTALGIAYERWKKGGINIFGIRN